GNWTEDVPHPNRFRAPMEKRIKHCIAIFDTVANTMAEIVSGGPLAVTSKTSYPESAPLVHEHTIAQITDLHHYSGTGSPEGKVTAPVGATYVDTAATNGAIRWLNTSGTGSTGWTVEYGSTGSRDISSMLTNSIGDVTIERIGQVVYLEAKSIKPEETLGSGSTFLSSLPSGFRPAGRRTFSVNATLSSPT